MKELDPKYIAYLEARTGVLRAIEAKLGYQFSDQGLLSMALTHASTLRYARTDGRQPDWLPDMNCNERLEFLGDAVLDCVISDMLYRQSIEADEGDLSKRRATLVCEASLAAMGRELGLESALLVGPAEFRDGLHWQESALADAFEAVIAALFRDSDFATVYATVGRLFHSKIDGSVIEDRDYKTALQEWLQARYKDVPTYLTENSSGEAHKPYFEVSVQFKGKTLGRGHGSSKKKASQIAAQSVLKNLENKSIDLSEFVQ